MLFTLRKLFFSLSLNTVLLFFLIIAIQNSNNKSRVYLIGYETINLPISFVIGTSFICGSVVGFLLPSLNYKSDK